jgi:anti-sigma B factor antagonist
MHIDVRDTGGILTLHPTERITVESEKEFTSTVRGLLDTGRVRLVLDLADVPYMDSIGIGAVVQAFTSARRRGGDLKLLHLRHRNRELLTITRLLTVLETFESEFAAIQSFGPRAGAVIRIA